MIIDHLAPLLPKDNEEFNMQVKCLQAMLDTTIVEDLVPERGDRRRGQEPDHCPSPHKHSTSSITPPEERSWEWEGRDIRDFIRNRDACDQIENWHQEQDCVRANGVREGTTISMTPSS
jgi:hypothetical protein